MLPSTKYRGWIISFLVAAAVLILGTPISAAPSRVRFRTVSGFLVVVPVSVNGQGPFEFLLDTGTNTTLLDAELAKQLKLKPVGRKLLRTLTGSEAVPRYSLGAVTLGTHSISSLEALAQEMKELHALDSRIRGVLGLDFLLGFSFLLDYRHRRVELFDSSEDPQITGGTRMPIEVVRARILVSAASGAAVRGSWNLVLDSGIQKVAIFETGIACSQNCDSNGRGTIQVVTNLSSIPTRTATLRDFALAGHRLPDLPVVVLPANQAIQSGIEGGLLPAAFFRYILVNPKQGYMVFELQDSSNLPQRPNP